MKKTVHIDNINIISQQQLLSPSQLKKTLPLSDTAAATVAAGRQAVSAILKRKDHRMMVIIGPCSVHDPQAALDYAYRLQAIADEVSDTLLIIMRVYFEKPRTTIGWKGLTNDPHLNGSFAVDQGLHLGRKLLLDINEKGLPAATEALDPIAPQYFQDLISWSAIGARTTESQTHRAMASGLSSAVGFKNSTDGNLTIAINALQAASSSHCVLGINTDGEVAIIHTKGNPYSHIILRGGNDKPNYDPLSISLCEKQLAEASAAQNIMVDCSHANSYKKYYLQPQVLQNITNQILEGNTSIIGVMIESNINWGNQALVNNGRQPQYGVSITDTCIDWDTTEICLRNMRDKLHNVLPERMARIREKARNNGPKSYRRNSVSY